jgi:uncharacterized protein YndB with AHSA1/START domain
VPAARARRVVAAGSEEVWRVVGDPRRLARWWPRAVRVERVTPKGFTLVLRSQQGRDVRADQRVIASSRPRRRAWALEVAGTPFENVFYANEIEVTLEPAEGDATRVTIEQRQRLRGAAKMGGFLVRGSARKQLKAALDGLEQVLAE